MRQSVPDQSVLMALSTAGRNRPGGPRPRQVERRGRAWRRQVGARRPPVPAIGAQTSTMSRRHQ
eukprot:6356171-Pyramimonas_sp.AAC.1